MPKPHQLPARRPRCAVPERVTDVRVAVEASGGFAGWSVQVESREPVSGFVAGGLAEAGSQVLGVLQDLSRERRGRLALHSANPGLDERATRIAGVEATPVDFALRDGRRALVVRMASCELASALAAAPRLVVAVDGSWGRGSRMGGWAFVSEDGTFASASGSHVAGSAEPELRSILMLLRRVPAERALSIQTDSRAALAWLRDPTRAPRQSRSTVHGIAERLDGRDVTLSWVKGHAGQGLHDGADRLAVAARRAREGQLGSVAPAGIAERIVAESVDAHRRALARSPRAHGPADPLDPGVPFPRRSVELAA
jgi:ribonuclease HI